MKHSEELINSEIQNQSQSQSYGEPATSYFPCVVPNRVRKFEGSITNSKRCIWADLSRHSRRFPRAARYLVASTRLNPNATTWPILSAEKSGCFGRCCGGESAAITGDSAPDTLISSDSETSISFKRRKWSIRQ